MSPVICLLALSAVGYVCAQTTIDTINVDLSTVSKAKTTVTKAMTGSAPPVVTKAPTGTAGPVITQVCKSTPADLVFLLDSSGSEGATNFEKQLDFVSNIVDQFNIGPDAVQVSVVTFSTSANNEFWLDEHENKTELIAAVKSIQYKSGNTHTELGLEFVRTQSFLPEHGARNNTAKVLIVLTDGQSTEKQKTIDAANSIHNTNIKVISIGVGSQVDNTELKTIATDDSYFFAVANFSDLATIEKDVVQTTCKTEQLSCRSKPADIVFLLDSSGSEHLVNFKKQLEFVNNFIKDFEIGPDAVQISVVTFASAPKNQFWLDEYSNKTDMMAAVLKISYSSGNTQTDDALKFVRQHSFDPAHGARNDSKHVLIVLTDGQSAEKANTANEASAIHKEGINVIAIGIGDSVDFNELTAIATDPQSMFKIATFDALKTIEKGIQQVTCNSCKDKPLDVVFLLDTSVSEGPDNFQKQLDFVTNFAKEFTIGPDAVQISVVTFSSDVKNEFWLNQYSDKTALQDAIQRVKYRTGTTQTDDGLKFVRENSFNPSHGARNNSQQVLIILTDGQSTERTATAREAALMHSTGVNVISIGIGKGVRQEELKTIASNDNNVFTVANFEALQNIEKAIRQTTCEKPQTPCKSTPADIIFLLDSSGSEGSTNFNKQLTFVHNFIDAFDIGPDAVQFGVVSFSTRVYNRIWLNTYSSKPALLAAVDRIPYTSGNTQTGQALQFVHQTALSSVHGARSSAQPVVIVLTDGQSTRASETRQQATSLRNDGIKVIAIGIGRNIDNSELAVIATDQQHVFRVANFDALHAIQKELQTKTCQTVQLVCRSNPADIVFVLDSSGSEGRTNFQKQLAFVSNFIKQFDIGSSAVQISIVTFSTSVHNQFYLNAYSSKPALLTAVGKVPYTGGLTHTYLALNFVRQTSFTAAHGSRPNAVKIAVVMTDGQSNNRQQTAQSATSLHNNKVEVIAIGIGSRVVQSELQSIASDNQHVFTVQDFNALHTIQRELGQATCNVQTISTTAASG